MINGRRCGRAPLDPHKIRRALTMDLVLKSDTLPPSPPSTNMRAKLTQPLGVMLNDREGCCTISSQGHTIQNLTASASAEVTVPDTDIQTAYVSVTGAEGAAFDPATGRNDNGCQLSDAIDYMVQVGMSGHKFLAKLNVNFQSMIAMQHALYLFGNLIIGVDLTPQTLQSKDTWDIPDRIRYRDRHQYRPSQSLGHAIAVLDYNADGSIIVASWGQQFIVTPNWQEHCLREAWVVLSPDWKTASNIAPNMIDWPTLQTYFPALAAL